LSEKFISTNPMSAMSKKALIRNELVKFVSQELDDVIAAYLFGSFIGTGQFSDIDIGLLIKDKVTEILTFELSIETRLNNLFRHPFDVRVLNYAPNSFVQNVIRTGMVVVDKNPCCRANYESRVLKQYFDFAYFRRRYLKEVGNVSI
jgi:hypothetical protein